jgi:2-methylisocitrate lyase-like PEP mutase family enzyme
LRDRLAERSITLVPGVTSAIFARLAERAGMEAVFITGAGVANASLGVPDLGMATLSEIVESARQIVAAVDIPVIADADAGFGGHLNVMRAVRELEQAGVAGLILEDQQEPKRCGHFDGKVVVEPQEMVTRILAARRARVDPDLVILARTDAIAVEGLAGALERARLYVEAGADAIFVEAPQTREQMAAINNTITVPTLINMVEGGATPMLELAELQAMGFSIALYANLAFRVALKSVAGAFEVLRREGSSATLVDQMVTWEERQELVNFSQWQQIDSEIAAQALAITGKAPAANGSARTATR